MADSARLEREDAGTRISDLAFATLYRSSAALPLHCNQPAGLNSKRGVTINQIIVYIIALPIMLIQTSQ